MANEKLKIKTLENTKLDVVPLNWKKCGTPMPAYFRHQCRSGT
jgi:hypothetical protein